VRRYTARIDVVRSGFAESVHTAAACVRRADGEVLLAVGDAGRFAFPRSSLKPLQALAAVTAGVADAFSLEQREVAVFCGSHSGESFHVEAVESVLRKIGLDGSALKCGTHWPCATASDELRARGEQPRAAHNNCSGKHAGMLAACVRKDLPIEDYLDPEHPHQLEIRRTLASMTDTPFESVVVGIDGCAAPTLGVPIEAMALAFARLGDSAHAPTELAPACRVVADAMAAHPEMVAGTDRNCTRLMQATKGKLLVKSGAEAFFAAAIPAEGIGIAVKVLDGGARASVPVALACLAKLGLMRRGEHEELDDLWVPSLKNCRGDVVGEIRATLDACD